MDKTINRGGRPRKLAPLEELGVYRMHRKNASIAEIAYKYGISPSTVQRTVKRVEKREGKQ